MNAFFKSSKIIQIFRIFLAAAALFLLNACSCNIKLSQNKSEKNLTDVEIEVLCGKDLEKLINSTNQNAEKLIDENQIQKALIENGCKNVKVVSQGIKNVKINFAAEENSFLYTSKILEKNGKEIKVHLTRQTLVSFYENLDDSIKMLLDLFIAPVFNDEEMTEDEYLETIAVVYGENVSSELRKSEIKINSKTVSFSKIATLDEDINL